MTPLRYVGHDDQPHFHRKHIAVVCILLGLVAGTVCGVMIRSVADILPVEKAWHLADISCVARRHEGDTHVFFMKNSGLVDFVAKSTTPVYGMDESGLVPDAGRLQPVAIPRGLTVACVIIGKGAAFVWLDSERRHRLEFR